MQRSFTNRILGGVCGGIAARLPVNAWSIRILFALLTALTLGAFALVYLILWLALPMESLAGRTSGHFLWGVFSVGLIILTLAGWYGRVNGMTASPTGIDLFYPVLILILSLVFLLRQVGKSA
jgi:phage shock protein PspC (stress-responsive transcriptional regulator)